MSKKLFQVEFPGVYMGGVAIVRAESAKQAEQMVKDHSLFIEDCCGPIRMVTPIARNEDFIYMDNGDY